jgi:glucose-6-phosphate-specific signal transduction histidine kinase
MTVEKVSKDSCIIKTNRGQAKELFDEITDVLADIRKQGHIVTRTMEDTKVSEGKVEYLVNGMSTTKVKNLLEKTIRAAMVGA